MAQLELNLDAFLNVGQQLKTDGFSLPGVITVAVLSGVDSFSLSYDGRSPYFSEKDLELAVAAAMRSRFALRVAPRAELIQLALSLPVKQLTFCAENLFEDYSADLETFIPQIKDAGKLVSFHLDPDLNHLKKAYKLQADLVELNVQEYAQAQSPAGQAELQEHIALMARTAEKNGIGVSVKGGVSYQNVTPLVNIDAVENVVAGRTILGRSVFVGLESAIRDFKALIL